MTQTEHTESQCKQIINHLLSGKTITAIEALHKFNCMNLKGRIFDIRQKYRVKTEMFKLRNGKRIAKYSIPV